MMNVVLHLYSKNWRHHPTSTGLLLLQKVKVYFLVACVLECTIFKLIVLIELLDCVVKSFITVQIVYSTSIIFLNYSYCGGSI